MIHAESMVGAQTAARQLAGGFGRRLHDLRDRLVHAAGLLEVELDFSEEGYEFVSRSAFVEELRQATLLARSLHESAHAAQVLRSGFYCAVVGFPNAGKSSLFNALLDRSRAIVSNAPGTTRDFLEEAIIIDGYTVHLFDTAGLRETTDTVELQGMLLTSSVIEQSDLVLVVNDAALGLEHSNHLANDIRSRYPGHAIAIAQNKSDLLPEPPTNLFDSPQEFSQVVCSAVLPGGVQGLRSFLLEAVSRSATGMQDALVNRRQATLLRQLEVQLASARETMEAGESGDLVALDLRAAIATLGEITGETWNPDILDAVFSRFCIGK
jgi:tRNA modification GTPase